MGPFLCTKDLSREAFVQLVRNYAFPANALLMATTPAATRFEWYRLDEDFFLESDGGRIFWTTGELKWRKLPEVTIRTVYLGDDAPPKAMDDCSEELSTLSRLKPADPSNGRFILWGARTFKKNEWIEQQVPHRFHYPVQTSRYSKGRVALKTENWVDRSGQIRFTRYHDIEETEGED